MHAIIYVSDYILQVTSDGSIDCANNPAEQEASTAQLHYCEVVCALHVLTPGGSLVIKMFTLLEDSSVCLMFMLNCVFKQVIFFTHANIYVRMQ